MKNILLLFILTLLSCNSKKKEEVIREQESIIILQTLLEARGLEMVQDSYSEQKLPICLNLKKILLTLNASKKQKLMMK